MAKSRQHKNWDEVFQSPQDITVESLNTGYIIGTKEGMFNVHSEVYQNQCSFKKQNYRC
ncbi:hypothetical protein [Lachnoclostridium phytofermentans]|uniref:hypothetical protein n=1 Tax=Lachnoclostridium phytofermentans TaxID=66219 RepID=UPI0012FBA9E7|nr:hypothetical protein [Lachnoclostridium phytofermentans]